MLARGPFSRCSLCLAIKFLFILYTYYNIFFVLLVEIPSTEHSLCCMHVSRALRFILLRTAAPFKWHKWHLNARKLHYASIWKQPARRLSLPLPSLIAKMRTFPYWRAIQIYFCPQVAICLFDFQWNGNLCLCPRFCTLKSTLINVSREENEFLPAMYIFLNSRNCIFFFQFFMLLLIFKFNFDNCVERWKCRVFSLAALINNFSLRGGFLCRWFIYFNDECITRKWENGVNLNFVSS